MNRLDAFKTRVFWRMLNTHTNDKNMRFVDGEGKLLTMIKTRKTEYLRHFLPHDRNDFQKAIAKESIEGQQGHDNVQD